ncbi:hypothetical protein KC992_03935 [Candidatus Saccharibacteria bacterium]|nr:hypothetical protein [Candidatus Saccharibacteria bacterium]MCA9328713.1 hypothetical protein [Candidatus Saccharibacteria bacterium]
MSTVHFETAQPGGETVERRGVFETFRQWVVGVAQREPVPNYGFGGPKETPFANSIPTPDNAERRLPLAS